VAGADPAVDGNGEGTALRETDAADSANATDITDVTDVPARRREYARLTMDATLMSDISAISGLPASPSGNGAPASDDNPAPPASLSLCSEGAETALCFDETHGVVTQVVGRSRLVVFPPDEHPRLYPFSAREGDPHTSRVDLCGWRHGDAAERHQWPNLARSHCMEAVLSPGDVAYIPAGHWHHRTALAASVAVCMPFELSSAERRAQSTPWARSCWGRTSAPIVGPTGLRRAILLPSAHASDDDIERRLGAGVWSSAFCLADALQASGWQQRLRGSTVLELGSGAVGYPGMVAALHGGPDTRVTLTDKHADLVDSLRRTLGENGLAAQCNAAVFDWHEPPDEGLQLTRPFDVILASDCLYSHDTAGAFCDALEAMSGAATRILVSAEERWSLSECIEIAAGHGWAFTQIGGARRPSDDQLECVPRRYREMGEGRCYVYAVTRAADAEPTRAASALDDRPMQ